MKIEEDLYESLGIDRNADQEEVKKAYRKKASKSHPDKGGDEEEFVKISIAYKILSDPDKRKEYDATGITSETSDIEKAAISHVKSLVAQAIKQDCENGLASMYGRSKGNLGVAHTVISAIKNQIAETKTSIKNVEDVIMKLEKASTKFKLKDKAKRKTNIFGSTASELIENSKDYKVKAENQLKMLELAYEIASDYEDVESEQEIPDRRFIQYGI